MRKTLGKHEIAVVQTTAVDQTSRTVQLTTLLAHTSGQWISSEWPVCPVTDTNAPRRMGAALTYARRYALFTLVGIAGEDDLDAPDLPLQPDVPTKPSPLRPGPSPRAGNGRPIDARSARTLNPEESQKQRDQLLHELEAVSSFEDAAAWAKRTLPIKNTLTADHLRELEAAVEIKIAPLAGAIEEVIDEPERTDPAG